MVASCSNTGPEGRRAEPLAQARPYCSQSQHSPEVKAGWTAPRAKWSDCCGSQTGAPGQDKSQRLRWGPKASRPCLQPCDCHPNSPLSFPRPHLPSIPPRSGAPPPPTALPTAISVFSPSFAGYAHLAQPLR